MDQVWSLFERYSTMSTPMSQVFLSFSLGVLFSPWSWGLFYLTLYIILFEIVLYCISGPPDDSVRIADYPDGLYYAWTRLGVLSAAYSGYIIGMTVCKRHPLDPECGC